MMIMVHLTDPQAKELLSFLSRQHFEWESESMHHRKVDALRQACDNVWEAIYAKTRDVRG